MSEVEQKSRAAIQMQDQNREAILKTIGAGYHDGVVVNNLTPFIQSHKSDHLDITFFNMAVCSLFYIVYAVVLNYHLSNGSMNYNKYVVHC